MKLVDLCAVGDPVTPRNPRRALDDQVRKSDAHSAPLNASITLRDILLKAGEAGSGGTNGTFDFDLLGMSSTASPLSSLPLGTTPRYGPCVHPIPIRLQLLIWTWYYRRV